MQLFRHEKSPDQGKGGVRESRAEKAESGEEGVVPTAGGTTVKVFMMSEAV